MSNARNLGELLEADGEVPSSKINSISASKLTGTIADARLSAAKQAGMGRSGGQFTGAVTTNSTFDGRNISIDGTKLDAIEENATADQTAAQIKTHLEDGIDSIHYVDGSIDTIHIGDDQVTAAKLANSINSEITANTAKTGITSAQASAITANTAKTGITSSQASAITANTAKTGITSSQASAITANTAKTGITSSQASAITANTAKVTNSTNASDLASGTVASARLGSGTANTTTFLRGDNAWATVNTNLVADTSPQLGGDLDLNSNNITGTGGIPAANLTGTVAAARLSTATTQAESDDSTKIATTAYVVDKITTLIGGAPSTLNDLNELAAAINDDASYNSTLTTALSTKMPKSGGAFTGAVTTNSTFDGRDVATDGTKLDTIETNATADQSATQIKAHLVNGIDSVHYVNGSIDAVHIASNSITATQLAADCVGASELANNSVASANIIANSITAGDIGAGAVGASEIGNDVVNSQHYAAGSIDNEHIADNAVNSEHYADGSIDRAHLAADVIDSTKLANDSVNSEHYVDGSIDTVHIGDDQVTAAKLANSINSGIAANTAKTGITSGQASAITANTAKTGITSSQATAITAAMPKAGGTHTGSFIGTTSTRNQSMIGSYSSTKTDQIWSMGNSYRNSAAGTNFGNLYGLAYKHTNNATGGTMGSGHQTVWVTNGTARCSLGTNIWTSGNVTAYSDVRVKENLVVIPNAIDKVKQLNGYTFDRTDQQAATPEEEDVTYDHNPTNRHVGVIAQEVLKVLPEAVTGGPNSNVGSEDEHYSVAYGNMVALLIEAIKEQQVQIDELKALVGGK